MSYAMYTKKADGVVKRSVDVLIAEGVNGGFKRAALPHKIKAMIEDIAASGFGEVWDTEPQYEIEYEVNKRLCTPKMWQPISRWDW